MKRWKMHFLSMVLLASLCSCTSDKFDYRDRYTGHFKVSGNFDGTSLPFDVNNIDVEGKATVNIGDANNQITLEAKDFGILEVITIDLEGKLLNAAGETIGQFTSEDHFDILIGEPKPSGDWESWDLHCVRR